MQQVFIIHQQNDTMNPVLSTAISSNTSMQLNVNFQLNSTNFRLNLNMQPTSSWSITRKSETKLTSSRDSKEVLRRELIGSARQNQILSPLIWINILTVMIIYIYIYNCYESTNLFLFCFFFLLLLFLFKTQK